MLRRSPAAPIVGAPSVPPNVAIEHLWGLKAKLDEAT
jgi:hypothetical protein